MQENENHHAWKLVDLVDFQSIYSFIWSRNEIIKTQILNFITKKFNKSKKIKKEAKSSFQIQFKQNIFVEQLDPTIEKKIEVDWIVCVVEILDRLWRRNTCNVKKLNLKFR